MVGCAHDDDKTAAGSGLSALVDIDSRGSVNWICAEDVEGQVAVAFGTADKTIRAWAPGRGLAGVSRHPAKIGERCLVDQMPSIVRVKHSLGASETVTPGTTHLKVDTDGTFILADPGDPVALIASRNGSDTSVHLVGQLADPAATSAQGEPVIVQRAQGDTDDFPVNTDDHTIWTYAGTQAVVIFPATHQELFVASTDAGDTHDVLMWCTRSDAAGIPHEEVAIVRTLAGQTPVSLFATPGVIDGEDPMICRSVANVDGNNAGEIFVGWDAAGAPGFLGGVPPDDQILSHMPIARGVSAVGHYTIPGGYNGGTIEVVLGNHRAGDVWVRQIRPGTPPVAYDSFRLPLEATTFSNVFQPRWAGGSAISPTFFQPGETFMLMTKSAAGGAGTTIAGGEMAIELREIA